ncbi:AMP-dependent synthetase [Coleophoma cylindrospora]|uniref:AMP-dependent synthetase n=1 Tax=Coleophoma cylindrospora TaxID=1849047 RepID=A0A3D8SPG5_9HELO|nr:AMP-dependent synthetase [Coleophoma cylindrospora]
MGFDNLMMKFDQLVTSVLGEWDMVSTVIFTSLVAFFIYCVITSRDPDAHPMLLARQSQPSPVRHEGQSAIYRSHSAPHGIPLNSGLNVKDPGDSKWARGRDGDIRDIWRKFISGPTDHENKPTGVPGKLMTVLGKEKVIEHNLAEITRSINLIGQQIKQNGGSNVAIYLPNSVEFLATLFACAFYNLTVVLLPFDQPPATVLSLLKQAKVDTIVAAVGAFPFDEVTKSYPALKQVIWVVDEGNKHMDWNEVPTGTGGAVNVSTWQDIIQDQPATEGTELPELTKDKSNLKNILAFWPSNDGFKLIEYTPANIVAGIAGQIAGLPNNARINQEDLFLPADSLSTLYPLTLTLAAMYSGASLALNSVAGRSPDLTLATQGIAPTIIVASASTLAQTYSETAEKMNSSLYALVHWLETRTLVQYGVMPIASTFSRMYDNLRPILGTSPGKLRLIFVSEQAGVAGPALSSLQLSDLRIYTGSRIVYALTAGKVVGAISQTGICDYRITEPTAKYSHFGAPLSSVEVFFKDTPAHKTTDESVAGEIVVCGPAVVGGQAALGLSGKILSDHTLAYV